MPVQGPAGKRLTKPIVVALVIVVGVLAVAYALVLGNFSSSASGDETVDLGSVYDSPRQALSEGFLGAGKVLSVDIANKSQMTIRISLDTHDLGRWVDVHGTLLDPVDMFVVSSTGSETVRFGNQGQALPIVVDVTVNLEGRLSSYPFDHYDAKFTMFVNPPIGSELADHLQCVGICDFLPTLVHLRGGDQGYQVDIKPAAYQQYEHGVRVRIHRGASTLFFAIFVMVLMWAIALAAVAMAVMLILLKREIGAGVLGYLAAVLFAFPAIRDALPGIPSLGTWFDYLAFFWAETIVAIVLVVLAVLWVLREFRSPAQPAA